MIKNSDKTLKFFEKIIPNSWQKFIEVYSSKSDIVKKTTVMSNMMKQIITIVLLNGVIIYTIAVGVAEFLVPLFLKFFPNNTFPEIITLIVVISLISPFLWAVMFKLPGNVKALEVVRRDDFNKKQLSYIQIVRIIIGLAAIIYLGSSSVGILTSCLVVLPIFIMFFIIFHRFIRKVYHFLEQIFMTNFHSRETAENEKNKQ
jgi:CPA2 family monovalent cation:H+ antiporter-2